MRITAPPAHGGNNSSVVAVLNLPLIEDTLAIRGVVYDDNRGGYIDNVPSTFSRSGYDLGLALYNGGKTNFYGKVTSPGVVPANSETINNYLQCRRRNQPRSPTRASASASNGRSTITGTRCCSSPTRT
jgi:hypothetical protein